MSKINQHIIFVRVSISCNRFSNLVHHVVLGVAILEGTVLLETEEMISIVTHATW